MHPGEHWRELMSIRGVSQLWVAGQMGVSQQHLNRIVRGVSLPSVRHVVAFAQVVEFSPELLWHLQAVYELDAELGG